MFWLTISIGSRAEAAVARGTFSMKASSLRSNASIVWPQGSIQPAFSK
ncbi:MAG: hypothetical protein AB7P40_26870 [Chloroflexota bacterium]